MFILEMQVMFSLGKDPLIVSPLLVLRMRITESAMNVVSVLLCLNLHLIQTVCISGTVAFGFTTSLPPTTTSSPCTYQSEEDCPKQCEYGYKTENECITCDCLENPCKV